MHGVLNKPLNRKNISFFYEHHFYLGISKPSNAIFIVSGQSLFFALLNPITPHN